MPDIELRFHHDMLVLSAPADAVLARQGIDAARDRQYLNLMEPDAMRDAQRLELLAGAQCLVTATEDITRARLAHLNMDGDASQLARAALDIANELKPQHVLVEIGPCGLPLDPSSKASLNENRGQYADAARAFEDGGQFDAFFLNGFTNIADLKCALMGVAQVSGKPVFASVTLGEAKGVPAEGAKVVGISPKEGEAASSVIPSVARDLREAEVLEGVVASYPFAADGFSLVDEAPTPPLPMAHRAPLDPAEWPEALDAMADLGAAVVGFETADPIAKVVEYASAAVERTSLPVLAQLRASDQPASGAAAKGLTPLHDIDAYTPDTMEPAAVKLFAAGVQFLRATGAATPAFTGALAATVQGLDVRR